MTCIPTSALLGDNVVDRSGKLAWHKGPTLLDFLETTELMEGTKASLPRFQVQYVVRPQTSHLPDYRGLAGRIASGTYQKGQRVVVLPSGIETNIEKIESNQQEILSASADMPVIMHLTDDVDASRGNSIVPVEQLPKTGKEISAVICWMDHVAFVPGQKMLLQQNSFATRAVIKEVISKIDIHSCDESETDGSMKLNDICKVLIKTAEPLSFDTYTDNRRTGAFILINENTNNTIAAGTIH